MIKQYDKEDKVEGEKKIEKEIISAVDPTMFSAEYL
jgi:hypothetical protein